MQAYAEHSCKRLLTHSEWEWAARRADDRSTPTGAALSASTNAAIHGESPAENLSAAQRIALWKKYSRDVGTSPDDVTPEGVCDMLGNVCEMTESAMVDSRERGGAPVIMSNAIWVLGGPWYSDDPPSALNSHEFDGTNSEGSAKNGFRCARSVDH